jgi:hypothetical protein
MKDPNKGFFETVLNQKNLTYYYFRKPKVHVIWQKKHSKDVGGTVTSPTLTQKGDQGD